MASSNGEQQQDSAMLKDEPESTSHHFDVDHNLIPQAIIDETEKGTLLPGSVVQQVYDQSVFESNVLAQVEKAAEREEREIIAARRRLIAEIDSELKIATGDKFDELVKKKKKLSQTIATASDVNALAQVLDSRSEEVRLGKATPFGTTVIHESEASTAFDDFLSEIGTKRHEKIQKQKQKVNRKSDSGASSSAAAESKDSPPSMVTLHSDLNSVERLMKHKEAIVEEDDDLSREYASEDDEDAFPSHGKRYRASSKNSNEPFIDDADFLIYSKRLKKWEKEDELFSSNISEKAASDDDGAKNSKNEILLFDDGLKVPARLWRQLYSYQRTAVRWLFELHVQGNGGILADEMGLGKTVEISAFLFALRLSKLADSSAMSPAIRKYVGLGPVLIACPATLLRQWAAELHIWAPVFRSVILHNTTGTTSQPLNDLLIEVISHAKHAPPIVITSYATLLTMSELMLSIDWHYVILDEGHKVRNPDAKVTVVCKQFSTNHRIVVTGSPMQNNLKELWCLMDFVYPGKLGSIQDFMEHLAVPIVQGGYANASPVQLQTAYKCAVVLRDTINPYILRRTKNDVKALLSLPKKTEQVLFCRLTEHQENIYINYLKLYSVKRTIAGDVETSPRTYLPSAVKKGAKSKHELRDSNKGAIFSVLVRLRHICNHPDLVRSGSKDVDSAAAASRWQLSAKMLVVESLLKTWKSQGHRVLLFSQTKTMLDILERFIDHIGYIYSRMDGETPINQRQNLIKDFNEGRSSIFVFLLTTRVGGLGINLTGADRVVIFDPDWNPTTDTQARERAWRIGQTKDVVIYRLLTSGTIEEKVYHRQIFKQFLTNRVLKDPKQRKFFKVNDIHELFTYTGGQGLRDDNAEKSESKQFEKRREEDRVVKKTRKEDESHKRTRDLAKRLSQKLSKKLDQPSTSKFQPEEGKKKSAKRSVIVDGACVPNAVKMETAKANLEDEDALRQRSKNAEGKHMLKKLLKSAGVAETLDFEALVASRPDEDLINAEANRVAEAAVQALRKSQTAHFHIASSSQPPARFGTVKRQSDPAEKLARGRVKTPSPVFGRPDESVKTASGDDGQEEDNLVEILRKRAIERELPSTNQLEDEDYYVDEEVEEAPPSLPGAVSQDTENLLTDLRAFVSFQASTPGQATSGEIIEYFGKHENEFDDRSFRVFRAMLRRICFFARRPSDGTGLWTLKPRFR